MVLENAEILSKKIKSNIKHENPKIFGIFKAFSCEGGDLIFKLKNPDFQVAWVCIKQKNFSWHLVLTL